MRFTTKVLTVVLMLGSVFAIGQQSGTATFAASDDHTIDSIDLATLTPSVRIPVLKKIGAIPFDYSVVIRSACTVNGQQGGTYLSCGPVFVGNLNIPQLVGTPNLIGMRLLYSNSHTSGNCTTYNFYCNCLARWSCQVEDLGLWGT
jgi:hypothetical protein